MSFKFRRFTLVLLGLLILARPFIADLRRWGMPNTGDYQLKFYLGYAGLILIFWLYHKIFWKCPHCGKNPGYKITDTCPHCKEPLDS